MSIEKNEIVAGGSYQPEFVISSGSYKLDALLNHRGFPSGAMVHLFSSKEGSFKTSLSLMGLANVQKAGHNIGFVDAEFALDTDWAEGIGVDVNEKSWFYSMPTDGETALQHVEKMIEGYNCKGVILDSIDACLSEDTEILTNEGWKKHDEVEETEIVATFNKENGLIEYQKINDKINKEVDENLINIKHQGIDILVTKNHRMVYSAPSYNVKKRRWKTSTAREMSGYKCFIPTAGNNTNCSAFENDNLLALGTFIVADGSYRFRNGKIHSIDIHYKKERKHKLLKKILKSGDFKHTEPSGKEDYNRVMLYGDLARKIYDLFPNKTLTWNLLDTSTKQKELILDVYRQTDGHTYDEKGGFLLSSTEKINVDVAQALALSTNKTAKISEIKPSRKNRKTCYKLNIHDKNYRSINKSNYSEKEYAGTVWCVNVDNSYIVTRRKGKVAIVGNCQPSKYMESDYGESQMMQHAKLVGKFARRASKIAKEHDAIIWVINQMRTGKSGHITYNVPSGGKGLPFYSKINIEMRRKSQSANQGESILDLKINVRRNKMGRSFRTLETRGIQGKAIDQMGELVDLAQEFGFIYRAGSWWKDSEDETLGQTLDDAKKWVEENKQLILDELK